MRLMAIGVNELHDGSYYVERENYFGTYLLLLLKTSAMFWIDGEWRQVPETTAVFYSPKSIQRYKAIDGNYIDDWMHVEADPKEIERFGIQMNTPMLIKDAERTYTIFRLMKEEYYCHGNCNTQVVLTLLEALLFKLAESVRIKDDKILSLNSLHNDVLRFPMKEWTLADAARMVSLSISRFETLYTKEYGIPFLTDVIKSRITYAKELLEVSQLSIKQISIKCGYSNENYFSRQFKKVVGMTPLEYRKRKL